MQKNRVIIILLLCLFFPICLLAKQRYIQLTDGSIELNAVSSFREKTVDQFLRNNFSFLAFEKVSFKLGYGLLSVYDPIEVGIYSANMQVFSFLPFLKPVHTNRIILNLGIGFSEVRYHSNYANAWGQVDLGDGPFLAQHIHTEYLWRHALEYCIDLDYRIKENWFVGFQSSYFDFLDMKVEISDGFFTAGIKLKYFFITN